MYVLCVCVKSVVPVLLCVHWCGCVMCVCCVCPCFVLLWLVGWLCVCAVLCAELCPLLLLCCVVLWLWLCVVCVTVCLCGVVCVCVVCDDGGVRVCVVGGLLALFVWRVCGCAFVSCGVW